ncbi:hypothetical protein CTI12_AA027160 [Artemisia annua]|uniref:HTH OST-type domain-containing protein n=1 Tax=Artemisia annua TaxID=35608 RepID=A0A2U1QI40_ARTAN|nr:hypothetical protein CTI12_AA027160 [Artemisia annua]
MTNTDISTESSVVYKQIQEILGSYYSGMPLSANLSVLERSYWLKFKKSLHYQSLGVRNLDELLDKMGDMVVVFVDLKKKMKYVMSSRVVETRQNLYLKHDVQELFNRHCGEIKFDSFEDFYFEHFDLKLNYHFYGLTNLDHLCKALKDILEVEFDCSGKKVIKAVKCYNLRKRKNCM